ncbi:G-alpha-domain-containing protein [Xylaria grammica]|nr:G-alpha-domain-containing protein [Xylaria grammica]
MDPATIVQIVGTAVSLGDVVIKCIVGLRSLKSKYHDAPLVVSTIIGQLYMVQSALDQLAIWNKPEHGRDPRYRQLAWQVDNALDCFTLLVTALERRLNDFELIGENAMAATQRLAFLWGEKDTSEYSILLDRQVNALNLLLQAVQCNTLAQQQDLLRREESQDILQQAKDCSSSITGLGDSASFISENTAAISLMFDFDAVILASKIYQQAGRSHLRQAIRAHNQATAQEQPEHESQETSSQLGGPPRQGSPSIYSSPGAPPSKAKTDAVDQANGGSLQSTSNAHTTTSDHESQHGEGDTTFFTSSSQSSRRYSNQARILRLVNPWRRAPKPKIMTPTTPDSSPKVMRPISLDRSPKFLILGTSESGKSTVLQGMKLALEGSYTLDEKLSFREIIWSNIVQSTRAILDTMEALNLPLDDHERLEYHVVTIYMQPALSETTPGPEVSEAISALWLDEGFQSAYNRRNEYQLNDNAAYYAEEIRRLTAPDYVPTDEDVLRARWKTTGITETWFSNSALLQGLRCTILDVGGTRSERKKWIHGFPNTSAVLFTVDVTAYAKSLFEDDTVNRMQEQLALFDSIVNSRWFSKSVFVLIFTKLDLIEESLQRRPVEKYFIDYPYRTQTIGFVERYMQYLTDRFLSLAQSDKTAARIRVVQGNFVSGGNDAVSGILEAANELAPMIGYSD